MLRTSTETSGLWPASALRSLQHMIGVHLGDAAATIWFVMERARQRRALANLDGRLLRDVGLTPADVRHEIAKPFWRG